MSNILNRDENTFKFIGTYAKTRAADDKKVKDFCQMLKSKIIENRYVIFTTCAKGELTECDKASLTEMCELFGVSCTFED